MINCKKDRERDFVLADHECMASIRLAELMKAVDKIRLGRVVGGDFGVYGIENTRNAGMRREEFVIYRVADGESICLVQLPDQNSKSPSLILPTADGA
jgi:hypothetical protein